MKLRLSLILLILKVSMAFAQHGDNWTFGLYSGIRFTPLGVQKIKTKIERDTTTSDRNPPFQAFSYSDCDGNLVLYGSHNQMWNKSGYSLEGGHYKQYYFGSTSNTSFWFPFFMVPKPKSNRYLYYFFQSQTISGPDSLMYLVIDLNGDNGNGEVVARRFLSDRISTNLTYTHHANRKDIWILQGYDDTTLHAFLLTDTGVSMTPVVSKGVYSSSYFYPKRNNWANETPYRSDEKNSGFIVNNRGSKLVSCGIDTSTTKQGCVWEYDFDPSTGTAGNGQPIFKFSEIPKSINGAANVHRVAFSPDDSFCYLMTYGYNNPFFPAYNSRLYQYRMSTGKRTQIFSERKAFTNLQLGPDGSIYFLDWFTNLTTLYRIKYPNLEGAASRVEEVLSDSSFFYTNFLPKVYQPYYPLYYYSNLQQSPCADSSEFEIHVDTNFRSVTIDFGDGDSVVVSKPLQPTYKFKHKYHASGKYFFQIKAKVPVCDHYTWVADTLTYHAAPKRLYTSSKAMPSCSGGALILKDSFIHTNQWTINWGASSDTIQVDSGVSSDASIPYTKSSNSTIKWTSMIGSKLCPNYFSWSDSLMPVFYPSSPVFSHITGHSRDSIIGSRSTYFGCEPLALNFKDTALGYMSGTIKWDDSVVNYTQLQSKALVFKSGTHQVVVDHIDSFSCSAHDTFNVVVWQLPSPLLSVNDTSQCEAGHLFKVQNVSAAILDSVRYTFVVGAQRIHLPLQNETEVKFNDTGKHPIVLLANSVYGCRSEWSVNLTVMPQAVADFSVNDTLQCLDENLFEFGLLSKMNESIRWIIDGAADFNLNDSIYFKKTFHDTGSHRIVCMAVGESGCSDTVINRVYVLPSPDVEIETAITQFCVDSMLRLKILNSGSNLLYDIDWGNDSVLTNLSYGLYSNTYDESKNHKVNVTAKLGPCSSDTTLTVVVLKGPEVNLSYTGICVGDSTEVLSSSLDSIYAHKWTFGDDAVPGSKFRLPLVFERAGWYKIKYESQNELGCKSNDSLTLEIFNQPVSKFEYANLSSESELKIKFLNRSQNATGYLWSVNNNTSTDFSPEWLFNDTGFYKVLLVSDNNQKCFDTSFQLIPVYKHFEFYFPNAFSPDRNGTNDAFGLSILQQKFVKSYELKVFNRWGEMVFMSDNVHDAWSGLQVPIGVYIYTAVVRDINGILHEYKGIVELLE